MVMNMHTLLAVFCVLLFSISEAKYVKDQVKGNDFVFLGKFCFTKVPENGAGLLTWNIHSPASAMEGVTIAVYDDDAQRWPEIYSKDVSCKEKLARSNWNTTAPDHMQYQIAPRDVHSAHFWYVAAVKCDGSINIDYELTFLNVWGDNKWIKQFSCDEVGLEGLYISYFIFFFLGALVHGYAVFTLIRSNSYHTIVKILSAAIGLEGFSVFCLFIHYAAYEKDGVGAPALKGIGDILDLLAQIVLVFLLILIAKGWCISKTRIEDRNIVLFGLGILTAAYLALFIWENVGLDPASTKYVYESAPGIIIIVLRGLALLWFLWCLRGTYLEENHPAKRQFYLWFGIMYAVWFLVLPFITIIAGARDYKTPWHEEMVTVMVLYVTTNALALAGLQYLLWPSRASEFFQISSRLDLAGTIPYDAI